MSKETLSAFSTIYSNHPSVSIGNWFRDTRPPDPTLRIPKSVDAQSLTGRQTSFFGPLLYCVAQILGLLFFFTN